MGPFDDDSYWAGERDALMGEHPEHDNVGYMEGWFSGMEEAEREIGGEEDDFDDEDDFEEDDEDDLLDTIIQVFTDMRRECLTLESSAAA